MPHTVLMRRALLLVLIAAAASLMAFAYHSGRAAATFSIAKSCAMEGTFNHDGHGFYCGDYEDMGPFDDLSYQWKGEAI